MNLDTFYGLDEICYPDYSLVVVGGIKEISPSDSIDPINVLEYNGIIVARIGDNLRPSKEMYKECISFIKNSNPNTRIYACGSGSHIFTDEKGVVIPGVMTKKHFCSLKKMLDPYDKNRKKELEAENEMLTKLIGDGEMWMERFLKRRFNINGNNGGTKDKGNVLIELFKEPTIIDREWWDANGRKSIESLEEGNRP